MSDPVLMMSDPASNPVLTMSDPASNPVLTMSDPASIPVLMMSDLVSATVLIMSDPALAKSDTALAVSDAVATILAWTQNQVMVTTAITMEMMAPMMEVHIDALPYFLALSIRLSAAALDDTTENINNIYETLFYNVIFDFSTCIGGNIYEWKI